MPEFRLHSKFQPTGDQPAAIAQLTRGLKMGIREQTLLGVTGSGKTFTMANLISITINQKPISLAPILTSKKIPPSMMKLTVCVTPPRFHCLRAQTPSSWLRSLVFMVSVLRIITPKCPCILRKPAILGR